jgi:hypothetical protein
MRELLSAEVAGELILMDSERKRAFALSPTLSLLWKHCDGARNVPSLASMIAKKTGHEVEEDDIWLGLRKLQKKRLLAGELEIPEDLDVRSRRRALKQIGLGAGALVAMMLPTPAQAATCFPAGHPCSLRSECCSLLCDLITGRCT